jgi:hypothetical protein
MEKIYFSKATERRGIKYPGERCSDLSSNGFLNLIIRKNLHILSYLSGNYHVIA